MNRIEMYSSSGDLKLGLHRVLATAHALTQPLNEGEAFAWWATLDPGVHEAARTHTMTLDGLAAAFRNDAVLGWVDEARLLLELSPLARSAVADAFRVAIISGKAHRAHMGRDVYGSSNKGLWDLVCADFGRAVAERFGLSLGEGAVAGRTGAGLEAVDMLRALLEFDTSPEGSGHDSCVAWLTTHLRSLGFSVDLRGRDKGRPLLIAHRAARGLEGHAVFYGHYDTTPTGREARWVHPPRQLSLADGRLHGRGVADNKGPLACRVAALARMESTPELTWLIQGEEETGSNVANALLPGLMRDLSATVWVDETGYHDHDDGTLRLLARVVGPDDSSQPVDGALDALLRGLASLASRWGIASRHERRGLNKSIVDDGCPFNRSLPLGARYVALGVNDSAARIHGVNESIPEWTFALHEAELDVLFRWVDCAARGAL